MNSSRWVQSVSVLLLIILSILMVGKLEIKHSKRYVIRSKTYLLDSVAKLGAGGPVARTVPMLVYTDVTVIWRVLYCS